MSASVGEGRSSITFWQRLKGQKHGLGNMALAASTLLLALRLVDQDKELERLRQGESSLVDALRRENQSAMQKFAGFRAAVEAEVERAGSRLPPLASRLRSLLEQNKVEEPRPVVSHEEKKGQEAEVLQSQGKGKTSFMV
ncbi:hypothetical protein M758_4G163400 [Ceratodon purpureus]|uniref:Uncharacterized protein n=1 Tax=Ceratodon purpureus TaxID=3225 RepID=A0A8T0IBB3_CERPU|nr:hypothetical protein KC19_4G162600 [Ceratodon purpureus]KAG0619768.1 hypothetical protein M758_4G163400 [Ceratodon purpureus]